MKTLLALLLSFGNLHDHPFAGRWTVLPPRCAFQVQGFRHQEQIKAVEDAFLALLPRSTPSRALSGGPTSARRIMLRDSPLLLCDLQDKAGVEVYLPHPEHKAFGAVASSHSRQSLGGRLHRAEITHFIR